MTGACVSKVFRSLSLLFFLMGAALSSMGCAGSAFPVVRPVIEPNRQDIARWRAAEYFVKARDYERRGFSQMAENFYKLAVEHDRSSAILRKLLVEKYLENGKYLQALLALKEERDEPPEQWSEEEKVLLSTTYLKLGRYQDATTVIEQMKQRSPQSSYTLAMLYESAGNLQKAITYYLEFFGSGQVSLDIGLKIANLMTRAQKYQQAELFVSTLEQQFGQSAKTLNMLGLIRLANDDKPQAESFFKLALLSDSSSQDALENLAQLAIQMQQYDTAVEYYERLYANPLFGSAYAKTLALLYYHRESYEKAESLLRLLLQQDMTDHELHYYYGLVALERENFELALLQFEKALALDNTFTDAWRQLVYLALREKRLDEAYSYATRFTEAVPKSPLAFRTLGTVLSARKEFSQAVKLFESALALDTTDSYTWFELGSALERQKKIDAAAKAFGKVLQLKPADAVTLNYLGYMWAENGIKLDSARLLLEKSLELDPQNGAYLDSYAWVLFKSGNTEQAYTYIQQALKFIDNDAVVFEHYGDILAAKQMHKESLEAYAKALTLSPASTSELTRKIDLIRSKLQP
jgi:tetratricopeptide (TPR) repeat protein